jgi:hypothetical protein
VSYLIPFVSLIGVVVGFLLSIIKEHIQNRPKVILNIKRGKFNYFGSTMDEIGNYSFREVEPVFADYFELELKVDIYNAGKGNTAIKEVDILAQVDKNYKSYLQPEMKINNNENTDYSFNLASYSILTLNLKLKVKQDDSTIAFFREDAISTPNDKNRLKFILYVTDIRNKETKVLVEPMAFLTAY